MSSEKLFFYHEVHEGHEILAVKTAGFGIFHYLTLSGYGERWFCVLFPRVAFFELTLGCYILPFQGILGLLNHVGFRVKGRIGIFLSK